MKLNFLLITAALLSAHQTQASDKLQYYFNHNQATSYMEPYRGITRAGDNFEAIIINEINKAKKTIDVAIHDLNVPGIAQALIQKKRAGIKVRMVFENDNNIEFKKLTKKEIDALDSVSKTHYKERLALIDINKDGVASTQEILERDTIKMLNANKVSKIDDTYDGSHGSGIMHHKFVVIDNAVVVQSSANFTLSDFHGDMLVPDSRGNQNALVVIKDSKVAKVFSEEFSELWNFKFGPQKDHRKPTIFNVGGASITVKFSADSLKEDYDETTNGLIKKTLLTAKKSIDVALFVFSEQNLSDAMEKRAQKGVLVSALVEPSFAYREYSDLLDLMGLELQDTQCRDQLDNNPWKKATKRAGIPNLPNGDMLHHKFGLIDQTIVIFGSHNWSEAANSINDEALLVIDDKEVGRAFKTEHNRLMKDAILGPSASLLKKIDDRIEECSGK
ncbi:MAG: phospholipase D-like domain-containing protein [Bacteriovoracaceae bacterium]